jgi:heterodisulfide reductase subunit B
MRVVSYVVAFAIIILCTSTTNASEDMPNLSAEDKAVNEELNQIHQRMSKKLSNPVEFAQNHLTDIVAC